MGYNLSHQTDELKKKHRNHSLWKKIVGFLACVVVFCTTYALILPAITMEDTAYCGKEEHQHTDACYEKVLVCGKEESTLPLHTHTEECYTAEQKLTCGLEETASTAAETVSGADAFSDGGTSAGHTHTAECYDADGNLTCGQEETAEESTEAAASGDSDGDVTDASEETSGHTHTDACYSFEQVLSCGQEENTIEPHTHSAECYEDQLVCTQEEHTHTLSCYSNPDADVETEEQWEATLPEGLAESAAQTSANGHMTRAERLIAAAKSQLGYHESTKNYDTPDGMTKKGYTRYGAWYGDTYGDWTAMFVSFCLNYAEIPETVIPYGSDCSDWITALQLSGLYADAAAYTPQAGDILFLKENLAAVITNVNTDADGNLTTLDIIVGDSNDAVESQNISVDSADILGYAMLPVDPADVAETTVTTTAETTIESTTAEITTEMTTAAGSETTTAGTETTTEILSVETTETAAETTEMQTTAETETAETTEERTETVFAGTTEAETETTTAETTVTNTEVTTAVTTETVIGTTQTTTKSTRRLAGPRKSASAVGNLASKMSDVSLSGVTYDGTQDNFTSKFSANFQFSKSELENTKVWAWTTPSTIAPLDSLVDQDITFYDTSGTTAGTYKYTKNDDGTYTMTMTFDESYVSSANDTINGTFSFDSTITKEAFTKDGKIEVTWSDNNTVSVDPKDIKWPEGETLHYDISTTKTKSSVTDNTISYTIEISSNKGTPDTVTLTDVLTANGITVENLTSVIAYKGEYNQWNVLEYNETSDVSYSNSGTTTTFTLPKLEKNGHYKVVYTYTYSGPNTGEKASIGNTVTAKSEDKTTGEILTDTSSTNTSIDKTMTVSKSGNYNKETGRIDWKVEINSNRVNIKDYVLTDSMFSQVVDGTLSISPSDNAYTITYVKDEDGKDTAAVDKITFGDTSEFYTITYSTPVESEWDGQSISNTSTMTAPGGAATEGGDSVWIPGGSLEKTMDGATVASDEKTAEVNWTVTVNLPETGLEKDTVLYDEFSGKTQYLTVAQIKAMSDKLKVVKEDESEVAIKANDASLGLIVTFTGSDGVKYTFSQITGSDSSVSEDLTFTNMKIELPNGLAVKNAKKLVLSYTTTADLNGITVGKNAYTNKAKVNNTEASATYTYYGKGVKKTDGNGNSSASNVESTDGTLTWKVQVNIDNGGYKTLTITDTLPEGVILTAIRQTNDDGPGQYYGLTYDASAGTFGGSAPNYSYSGSYNSSTRVLSITITPIEGKVTELEAGQTTLTLTCKIADDKLTDSEGNEVTTFGPVTNSVKVTTDKGNFGSAEQTQTWTKKTEKQEAKVVSKSSEWDTQNQRLDYQVVLNPEKKDLDTTSDTVTLTDKLEYNSHATDYQWLNMELLQSTVKLYEASYNANGNLVIGNEIKDWSWTYDTVVSGTERKNTEPIIAKIYCCTITATIPDKTMLVLQYAYSVDFKKTEGADSWATCTYITNTASVTGGYSDTDSSHNNTQWEESHSSAYVWTGKAYTLYKVSADNYGNTLEGATFALYKWDSKENKWVSDGTFTTGSDGLVKIHWQRTDTETIKYGDHQYDYNTAYYLMETEAPDGYMLPAKPTKYYFDFKNSDTTTYPNSYPDDYTGLDLSSEGKSEYVTNTERKKYTLTKVDADEETQTLPNAVFTLYKYNSTIGSYDAQNQTYTTDSNGQIEIHWQSGENDYQFESDTAYYLMETTAPDGYVLPAEAEKYYFYFGTDTTATYPGGFTDTAVNLNGTEGNATVTNEKIPTTSITVNKEWLDSYGNTYTNNSGSVSFKLYQLESKAAFAGTETKKEEESTVATLIYNLGGTTQSTETLSINGGDTITFEIPYDSSSSWTTPTLSGVSLSSGQEWDWQGTTLSYSYTQNDANDFRYELTVPDNCATLKLNLYWYGSTTVTGPKVVEKGSSEPSEPTSDVAEGGKLYTAGNGTGIYNISASDNNWSMTIDKLPVTGIDEEGNTVYYGYYVVEITTGYTTTYENDKGIGSGTIVIKNQGEKQEQYELPETGGIGTHWYTLGGLLLVSASGLLMYKQRRNRREGW